MITHQTINSFFNRFVALPNGTAFTEQGFAALADWGERQKWWPDFGRTYRLCPEWRSTHLGDSHLFALSLFAFLNVPGRTCEGTLCASPAVAATGS